MTIQINYSNSSYKKKALNLVFFTDESFKITILKKYLTDKEYSFISDLLKSRDKKRKILNFEISSKKKNNLCFFFKKNYQFRS